MAGKMTPDFFISINMIRTILLTVSRKFSTQLLEICSFNLHITFCRNVALLGNQSSE